MKKIDLHMHSVISDGTDTPEELLHRVREAGISLFSLTDHDAVRGCAALREKLTEDDPRLITGVEFSCREGEKEKYHILGYNYDPESPAIRDVVDLGHRYRMEKAEKRIAFLRDEFDIKFPEEEIQALMSLENPGKPHIAELMVKHRYVLSKAEAFDKYLDKANFPGKYVLPKEAIDGILASGGIPVLAHPAFGSGKERITGDELDSRLSYLHGLGLQGVEAFYSGFGPELIRETLAFAEKYGLYVTAGSDYHGKHKEVKLGQTNLDGYEPPEGLTRFLEAVS